VDGNRLFCTRPICYDDAKKQKARRDGEKNKEGENMGCAGHMADWEPWLQYAIRRNILHEQEEALAETRALALQDEKIDAYLNDVADFYRTPVKTHKDPGMAANKLLFLLDIGFGTEEPRVCAAVDAILSRRDENGVFQSCVNIPRHFGGSGENTFGWCLCDAPNLFRALILAGVPYETQLEKGVSTLLSLVQENGFPCAASPEFGKFRGPGKKGDRCPYATLIMLQLLALIPEHHGGEIAQTCAETLLSLWEHSYEEHPFLFYMGKDFRKLKAPPVWYDIVSVTDALSRFAFVRADERFLQMVSVIEENRDENGLFTPESVYLKCKGWDFGQKKAPSGYLTYCCEKIFQRLEDGTA
jgi:hypothetical protein